MKKPRSYRIFLVLFLAGLAGPLAGPGGFSFGLDHPGPASPRNGQLVEARIDWLKKTAWLEYRIDLDIRPENRLGAASRAEELQKSWLMDQAPLALTSLLADSRLTLKDYFELRPDFLPRLMGDLRENAWYLSNPAADLKSLQARLRIDLSRLYPVILGSALNKTRLEKVFSWQPAKKYTGIIIYMKDRLDWYGTDEKTLAKPALMIRLHDAAGRTFFDITNMEPEKALEWGTAAYATSLEEARKDPRIGNAPLVLSAEGVFGIHPVDPVVSVDDANLILFNESTRAALEQGRIIIILPGGQLTGILSSGTED